MKASKAAQLTLSHRQAQNIIEHAKCFGEDAGREITPEELLSRLLSSKHIMNVGCDMVRETVVARATPDEPLSVKTPPLKRSAGRAQEARS